MIASGPAKPRNQLTAQAELSPSHPSLAGPGAVGFFMESAMPKSPPSFDFYPNDWHGGVAHLPMFDRACYFELLLYQWANGHIPEDPAVRAHLCQCSEDIWRSVWARIHDKFVPKELEDGRTVLVNQRLDDLLFFALEKYLKNKAKRKQKCDPLELSKKRSIAGKKGGRPKSKKKQTKAKKANWEEGRGKDLLDLNKEKTVSKFSKPTVDEIREYCQERGNQVDPEAFHDFYQSKGWLVGKNRMKDWKAAVRTWEKNGHSSGGSTGNRIMSRAERGRQAGMEFLAQQEAKREREKEIEGQVVQRRIAE